MDLLLAPSPERVQHIAMIVRLISMRRFLALIAALAVLTSCGAPSPTREPSAAQENIAPSPTPDEEAFEVEWSDWGDLEEEVRVQADLVNHSERALTPTCYLVDRNVGPVKIDDPSPMEPGEERTINGTASFPVPSFNYECDGFCKGVECFVAGLEPGYIKACMRMYERIPAVGTTVEVPNIDGKYLSDVVYPLYKQGLKAEIGADLVRSWRDRKGPLGDLNPRNVLRRVLLDLLLVVGPRIRVVPVPGSTVKAGDTVVLHHLKS